MELRNLIAFADHWQSLDREVQDVIKLLRRAAISRAPLKKSVVHEITNYEIARDARAAIDKMMGSAARQGDDRLERELDDMAYLLDEFVAELAR